MSMEYVKRVESMPKINALEKRPVNLIRESLIERTAAVRRFATTNQAILGNVSFPVDSKLVMPSSFNKYNNELNECL